MALSQTYSGKQWYVSTTQLQLASIEFCVACRSATTLHLTVDDRTPHRLLARADAPAPGPEELGVSARVPRFRARTVAWHRRSCAELRSPIYALTEVQIFSFGGGFDASLDGVSWPKRVKTIHFGDDFDQSLDRSTLPPYLDEVLFGRDFNRPIDGVCWPASLRYMNVGDLFDQPILHVSWPPNLQELRLGKNFNQPIAGIAWPASLEHLTFGDWFNQHIDEVVWPSCMQQLSFGRSFDQPITNMSWPESLRFITLGQWFNQPLNGLSRSMPSLVGIKLLFDTNMYSPSLAGIDWPARLETLTVHKALWDKYAAVFPKGVELDVCF